MIALLLFQVTLSLAYAKTIVVYHTSDVHGWYSSRPARWNKENPSREIGGFPALSALVKKEKNAYMLLDSGDMFQGTPEGNLTRGMASVALMNKLDYKAATVGNHEYDYGENALRTMISSATFAFLGANVYFKETGKHVDYLKPYSIFEVDGKKIGVLGLATKNTPRSTLPENVRHLEFKDEVLAAAKWVPEIRKQGVDAIVVVVHTGMDGRSSGQKIDASDWTPPQGEVLKGTLGIARSAKGIAAVMGGHFHMGLINGYWDEKSETLLVESFWGLTVVSRVELEFDDKTGKLTGVKCRLIDLWVDETGKDPEVVKTLKPFVDIVSAKMDKVIGRAAVDLIRNDHGLDSVIGNWISDVMRRRVKADVAFQNTFGIRADIPKGKITLRHLFQAMPFDNTLVTMDLSGEQLAGIMRKNIFGGKTRMQLSGLKIRYKTSSGGKVSEMHLAIGGKPVDPKAMYKVVTNNYLATGGSGGRIFTEGKNIRDTRIPIREVMIEDVKKNSPVKMPGRGRIQKLGT